MTISTVNSYSATTTTTTSSSSSSSLGLTSEDFLELMLEQLQSQNPLDPTDTDTYLDRMVSYASYDTQNSISEQLGTLVDSVDSMISGSGLGYLGTTVEAYGNTTSLQDGSATWGYSLESDAESTTITITDSDGNTVWTGDGETDSGSHTFTWDGTTTDGTQLADGGSYTISVNATDADGDAIDGTTTVTGLVTGIDSSSGETVLQIGGAEIQVDNILSIQS
ncbi:flagellar basal-body rod modification protein FlgD [Breoghania corrubedonensis]|uniref:Basal-body rod modification protein FlgD n=1 Tax=Breoghania corrubedonensis TaxID=665038 RepID=A0A2T5V6F2_9HYPH|nr:FlgD immunoglobulin-like domain containing protein [Breoghania corrubedonensis]PTW59332.1 flagellar basal-body rod modification protein FlgD [Breoghania corrubedonensis]